MQNRKNFLYTLILILIIAPSSLALSFGGLDVTPADPNAETPNNFVYETKPGSEINDTIKVTNTSSDRFKIRIYAVDTTINNQNTEVLSPYTAPREDFAKWIAFENDQPELAIDIAPKETLIIPFKLKIPSDAEYRKHKGGIMVENLNTTDEETGHENIVVKTNARIGINSAVTITDTPKVFKKLSEISKPGNAEWTKIYFYLSIGIFVVALGALLFNILKTKKARRKSV